MGNEEKYWADHLAIFVSDKILLSIPLLAIPTIEQYLGARDFILMQNQEEESTWTNHSMKRRIWWRDYAHCRDGS